MNNVKTDNTKLLMSDALKQSIDLDDLGLQKRSILLISLDLKINDVDVDLDGKCVGLTFGKKSGPELEIRVDLKKGIDLLTMIHAENCNVRTQTIRLILDDEIVATYQHSINNTWSVDSITMHDINTEIAMCTLLIKLMT